MAVCLPDAPGLSRGGDVTEGLPDLQQRPRGCFAINSASKQGRRGWPSKASTDCKLSSLHQRTGIPAPKPAGHTHARVLGGQHLMRHFFTHKNNELAYFGGNDYGCLLGVFRVNH